jgi:hypothetical protein
MRCHRIFYVYSMSAAFAMHPFCHMTMKRRQSLKHWRVDAEGKRRNRSAHQAVSGVSSSQFRCTLITGPPLVDLPATRSSTKASHAVLRRA